MTITEQLKRGEAAEQQVQAMLANERRLLVETERLRAAHKEIVAKYEKIMGDPPDWTSFNGDDQRLKFAREAWFGAAQISRKALKR